MHTLRVSSHVADSMSCPSSLNSALHPATSDPPELAPGAEPEPALELSSGGSCEGSEEPL